MLRRPDRVEAGVFRPSRQGELAAQLDVERDFQRELGRSEDYKEGVAAFLAKRKPAFKQR